MQQSEATGQNNFVILQNSIDLAKLMWYSYFKKQRHLAKTAYKQII